MKDEEERMSQMILGKDGEVRQRGGKRGMKGGTWTTLSPSSNNVHINMDCAQIHVYGHTEAQKSRLLPMVLQSNFTIICHPTLITFP